MKIFRDSLRTFLFGVMAVVLALGCQQENISTVAGPDNEFATQGNDFPGSETVITTDKGRFKRLKMKPELLSAKAYQGNDANSELSITQFIESETGGHLQLDNPHYGASSICFGPNVLPQSDSIQYEWKPRTSTEGLIPDFELGPHGLQFNGEAHLTISYHNADLNGVDEDNLRVVYYNEKTAEWELLETEVNKDQKTVTVYLRHFSRFAIVHA